MKLRQATPADIPEITAIYADAVLHGTASWEWEPPGEDEMLRRMKALTEAGFPYLAAEQDGRVLGYAYAGPYRPRAAYKWIVEDSVYIAPDAKGKGVGKALVSELIAICEGQGFRQMIAVIGDSASAGSIALHRSLGFTDAGLIRSAGWKHGRWLNQVLMQRALGAGDTVKPDGA
jgi:phosphinothricin acetyltransferase